MGSDQVSQQESNNRNKSNWQSERDNLPVSKDFLEALEQRFDESDLDFLSRVGEGEYPAGLADRERGRQNRSLE